MVKQAIARLQRQGVFDHHGRAWRPPLRRAVGAAWGWGTINGPANYSIELGELGKSIHLQGPAGKMGADNSLRIGMEKQLKTELELLLVITENFL